ncbi:MAG TPA: cysteine desulfurase family protein [Terriglobales bacterium]|nr:cysteine desulfurase family protein [Terriglobales bacterium]
MRSVYLDNNATTRILPEVLEAMKPYFEEKFGNASSIYSRGREAHAALKTARQSVAKLLGCETSEIVFTTGGTEGDNLAILGMISPGDRIITSAIEHSAVLNCCSYLGKLGCQVTYLPVNGNGHIDPDDVRKALRTKAKLISVMLANNETGVLQPVESVGKLAAKAGVCFHVDAVQAAGKVPIDVRRIGCDLLTISGHKMHAQQGTGALFVKRGTILRPLLHGGHQEHGLRPGTENVPGIIGFGRACELAIAGLKDGSMERIGRWRDRFEAGVVKEIDAIGINGVFAGRVPNTSNIYFDYIGGEALVIALDEKGVSVSAGAACSAGAREPSHVMVAMGLSPERARASLRFSFGKQNSAEDVDYLLDILPDAVQRLRNLSPLYKRSESKNVVSSHK